MNPTIVFLDAGTFYGFPPIANILDSLGQVKIYEHTDSVEIVSRMADADIVLTNKVVLDRETFRQCPKLRLVCVTATGTNNIDLGAAKQYGITVKNASGYSTNSVAQTTFAMALHLLMPLSKPHSFVVHEYTKHRYFTHLHPGFGEIAGKTWGIIGLGAIGKKVAQIAEAFGAHVIYHSPSGRNLEAGFQHHSLAELLSTSDIISIHSPLNEHTKNLIGEKELNLCKPSSILLNVARGGIVDELALANALEENKLAGAGVDVFSIEPIEPNNPLLHLKHPRNLLLTPHLAWGSYEARKTLMEITCQNIKDFLSK